MRVLSVPLGVGLGGEPEVGAQVDHAGAVVEQALDDRRRLAVRRADEGDVDAAQIVLAAELEPGAHPRQMLLHRLAGERLRAHVRELDRGVAEQQLGEQRAGVAAAADDAGGGDGSGSGGEVVGAAVFV